MTQQRVAYSYGLLDGVLSDIRVDVRLLGLTLEVLEPQPAASDGGWAPSARLAIEETRFHFRRPEDDRKVGGEGGNVGDACSSQLKKRSDAVANAHSQNHYTPSLAPPTHNRCWT